MDQPVLPEWIVNLVCEYYDEDFPDSDIDVFDLDWGTDPVIQKYINEIIDNLYD